MAARFTKIMREMRAVRSFSDQPVPDDILMDILEVGRWTGSSKNIQPWQVIVVRDRATLVLLSTLGRFASHLATAQVALVLVLDGAKDSFDGGRLAERLMLAAWAHDIGSCIASIWPDDNSEAAKQIFGIPDERSVRQAVALGYPADKHTVRRRSMPRVVKVLPSNGRRRLSEFVNWERYGIRDPRKQSQR